MVAAGFTLAEKIPTVDRTFTLVQSDAVTKAQSTYRLLNVLGNWLPFVSLALVAAGVALARDRWRALMRGALGITASMVLLGAGLAIARTAYVSTTPAGILTPDAAGQVFDTLVRFLRTSMRAVALLGLVVALAAFLSGRSPSAARARGGLERGVARLRRSGEQATGRDTGALGTWLTGHRRALRVSVISLGALVLLLWSRPTAWVVLWTGLVVVLALGVLELLSAPPAAPAGGPGWGEASGPGSSGGSGTRLSSGDGDSSSAAPTQTPDPVGVVRADGPLASTEAGQRPRAVASGSPLPPTP
jgi:hypothetical protein